MSLRDSSIGFTSWCDCSEIASQHQENRKPRSWCRWWQGLTQDDTAAGEPGAGTALAAARGTPAQPVTASAVTESAGLQRSERSERSRQAAC